MQIVAFIYTFIQTLLLFRSKFERQGGFVGICLGLIFMGVAIVVIVGLAAIFGKKKEK